MLFALKLDERHFREAAMQNLREQAERIRALIGTDFSDDSAEAAPCARRIFKPLDMTLFHAYEVPFEGKLTYAGVSVEAVERYRHLAEEQACSSLAAFARTLEFNDAMQAVRRGPASLRIQE